MNCRAAQEAIHLALDSASLPDADRERLDLHLEGCDACRAMADDLATLQAAMRALPQPKLPDAALEEVWRQTTRSGEERVPAGWGLDWRFAAAAAAILFAVMSFVDWPGGNAVAPNDVRIASNQPSEAELAQAAQEARLVLGLTRDALNRTRRAVKEEVVDRSVANTLYRMPFLGTEPQRGRNGT